MLEQEYQVERSILAEQGAYHGSCSLISCIQGGEENLPKFALLPVLTLQLRISSFRIVFRTKYYFVELA
jgi:hypothetical protein